MSETQFAGRFLTAEKNLDWNCFSNYSTPSLCPLVPEVSLNTNHETTIHLKTQKYQKKSLKPCQSSENSLIDSLDPQGNTIYQNIKSFQKHGVSRRWKSTGQLSSYHKKINDSKNEENKNGLSKFSWKNEVVESIIIPKNSKLCESFQVETQSKKLSIIEKTFEKPRDIYNYYSPNFLKKESYLLSTNSKTSLKEKMLIQERRKDHEREVSILQTRCSPLTSLKKKKDEKRETGTKTRSYLEVSLKENHDLIKS